MSKDDKRCSLVGTWAYTAADGRTHDVELLIDDWLMRQLAHVAVESKSGRTSRVAGAVVVRVRKKG